MSHSEMHRIHRVGWLRAAVLGANDGIVSTASLILGVAAADATPNGVLAAGFAGLVAGSMSMAAGEYVSVSSQRDTEEADLADEQQALQEDEAHEHAELSQIYVGRGVDPETAAKVAEQLMRHDALGAHARDELGIFEMTAARPIQAAWTSALTFACGAALPLVAFVVSPAARTGLFVSASTLVSLAALGALAARAGGAPLFQGAARVTIWGAAAMALTTLAGRLFGAAH